MFGVERFEDFSHLLVKPRFEGELKVFKWYLFKSKVRKSFQRTVSWEAVRRELFGLGTSFRGG